MIPARNAVTVGLSLRGGSILREEPFAECGVVVGPGPRVMTNSRIDGKLDIGSAFLQKGDSFPLLGETDHVIPVSVKGPHRNPGECLLKSLLVLNPVAVSTDGGGGCKIVRVAGHDLVGSKSTHAQSGDVDSVGIDVSKSIAFEIEDILYLVYRAPRVPPERGGVSPSPVAVIRALRSDHDEGKALSPGNQFRRSVSKDLIEVVPSFAHPVQEDDDGKFPVFSPAILWQVEPVGDTVLLCRDNLDHFSSLRLSRKGSHRG